MKKSDRVVYGLGPIEALIKSPARSVHVVYHVAPGDAGSRIKDLVLLCKQRGVGVEQRSRADVESLAGASAVHQGVVAITGEFVYAAIEDVLETQPTLLVVLDGIKDPHNLGAIIRSAYVQGAQAVVIGRDRAAPVTAAAVKASAGATERLPICQVTNIARTLDLLKEHDIWTVGAVVQDAPAPWQVDLERSIALVVGSEDKGLRKLVRRSCDYHVQIPMPGGSTSFNVSVATGILLYEANRQRSQTTSHPGKTSA